jgi:hypothetical protein
VYQYPEAVLVNDDARGMLMSRCRFRLERLEWRLLARMGRIGPIAQALVIS